MGPKKDGFTTIELLTVLAIIAILAGILIPTVSYVRNTARAAKTGVQFATIDMALMAFKGDTGDYPPSTLDIRGAGYYYCGAQKLAEALLGWDLLGFHPKSAWRADGYDGLTSTGPWTYDPAKGRDDNLDDIPDTLNERVGPYLELGTASAFKLNQLFPNPPTTALNLNTYVLCDSFGAKPVTITSATGESRTVKVGRPILYYKANTNSKVYWPISAADAANTIYNYTDNFNLIDLKRSSEVSNDPLYYRGTPLGTYLYWPAYKLVDPKIFDASGGKVLWPCRPDSYILISAGVDGLYGTQDDICNF